MGNLVMTNKEYEVRKRRIELENRDLKRKRELKELRGKYRTKFKRPSTSKLALLAVFVICLEILIFAECFMWQFQDSTALYALIGVPVSLMPVLISYYNKSKAENCESGIVYEMAMLDRMEEENASINENEGVEDESAVG